MRSSTSTDARIGNSTWWSVLHEVGHAVGLKHPHDGSGSKIMLAKYDSLEFTVMSYKAYVGAGGRPSNEQWGFPQTYMRADIAALQHIYGIDWTTRSENNEYKWTPGSGNTIINGVVSIAPGANKIFLTIWDAGGNDTYNLSAYKTPLLIDLRAGAYSHFGTTQIAILGAGHEASGMVYNAYKPVDGDIRSLIENAIGGSGNDNIIGNEVANKLSGGAGNDTLIGLKGNDTLDGGDGNDILYGVDGGQGLGRDVIIGGAGADLVTYITANMAVEVDLNTGRGTSGDALGDTYSGAENAQGSNYNDLITGSGGANGLYGANGNDTLVGMGGDDHLYGGDGADRFIFGPGKTGRDTIYDFNVNSGDVISFKGNSQFARYADLAGSMKQSGSDVFITSSDGDIIILKNVLLASLSSNDFIF
ncbi:M10 family metallopeptidase C-terminal domain-containing protein [Paracoccus aminophilus]|nr:M10 family metallopeptidase C-terminal domain-containing protein [Paracoccus aminophilus]